MRLLLTLLIPTLCLAQFKPKVPAVVTSPVITAPPVVVIANPDIVGTVTCEEVNEENCLAESDLGNACRKSFPDECRPFIEESLEDKIGEVSNTKITIAPFSLENSGAERSALTDEEDPISNINITGLSSNFATLQIPAAIGKYQIKQFGTIAPVASVSLKPAKTAGKVKPTPSSSSPSVVTGPPSVATDVAATVPIASTIIEMPLALAKVKIETALEKRERWSRQAGYESCEEYIYERFDNLSAIEDNIAVNRTSPASIFNFIKSTNWLNYNQFLPNFPKTGRLFIGNRIMDPDWKPYHNDPILKNKDQNGNWPKNAFASYPLEQLKESTIDPAMVRLVRNNLNKRTNYSVESQLEMYNRLVADNISTEYLEQMQEYGQLYLSKIQEHRNTYQIYYKAKSDADYICMLPAGAGGGPSNCDAAQNHAANVLIDVRQQLSVIDANITQMLQTADRIGCFDTDNIKCDWAPSIMLSTLDWGLHKYRKRREEEFNMCNLALETHLVNSTNMYVKAKPDYAWILINPDYKKYFRYPTQTYKWKIYPQDFIKFMEFSWDYYKAVQQEMKEIKKFAQIPHPTLEGKKQVGNLASDSGFYGTEKLGRMGAGYSYDAGWMVKNYEQNIYRANTESYSNFSMYGVILGTEKELVDFAGRTATTYNKSQMSLSLKINGKNWVAPYGANVSSGYRFEVDRIQEKKIFSTHTYINVFGVPIRLEAGAYAGAGFKTELVNSFSRNASDDSLTLNSTGSFQPYCALTAYGSAAVDAVVARIGIRGRVDLLTLGLPLEIDHRIFKRQPDYLTAISTNTTLGIELGTLSGRLSAFMDSIFGDVEYTFFRWKGISMTHNLFTSKTEKPFALKFARQALAIE